MFRKRQSCILHPSSGTKRNQVDTGCD
jgi:hypothetical protein